MSPTRHRFRRRVTAAFVVVAAVSAGVVASVTFVLAREYRWRNFRSTSVAEANVALALAPRQLDEPAFQRLRAVYESRTDADMVAVTRDGTFSSSPALTATAIPPAIRSTVAQRPNPEATRVRIDGRPMLVLGARDQFGSRYFFFFSLQQLERSLAETARVALVAWAITAAAAGAAGSLVARRTLRPVAAAATAAEAVAAGDFGTRLPVSDDDEFGALAASFNHMTDEVQGLIKQLQEAAARERRFTADVAHELRTPLTGMSAAATVVGEQLDDLPAGVRRAAAVLVADVRRLRDLVLELLELSRLDAATDEVRPEPLRVRDAVQAVVNSADVRRRAEIRIEADADAVVLAEPGRLRQILANLLDNAAVHGGERVEVTARREDGATLIDVVDDGTGIPAADLPHVFERFYKSESSRGGGSGLGLAIAREHARAQDGDLWVTSDARYGTRFTLRLPAPPVKPR